MRVRFHKAVQKCREVGPFFSPGNRGRETSPRLLEKKPAGAIHPTVSVVQLELGSDNAVFIRGNGGGLSWDRGQELTCVDPATWAWASPKSGEKLEFQLLLNDEVWERGPAHVLKPGEWIELTPDFEWPDIPRTATRPATCRREPGSAGSLINASKLR